MKISELSTSARAKLNPIRCDCILEKHEGSFIWSQMLEYKEAEFLLVDETWVLLPIARSQHNNITILRLSTKCHLQ